MFDSVVMPDVHRLKSAEVKASSFIDEVIDHSKRSWSNVSHGQGTFAESAEVGTEAVLGALAVVVAAKFGLSKLHIPVQVGRVFHSYSATQNDSFRPPAKGAV
jgi:hypothetical protein